VGGAWNTDPPVVVCDKAPGFLPLTGPPAFGSGAWEWTPTLPGFGRALRATAPHCPRERCPSMNVVGRGLPIDTQRLPINHHASAGTARLNALCGPRREGNIAAGGISGFLDGWSSIPGSEPAPTVRAYSLELGADPCPAGVARGVQEARAKPPGTGADTMDTWLDNAALRRSAPRS
jgi:hypothetical protein